MPHIVDSFSESNYTGNVNVSRYGSGRAQYGQVFTGDGSEIESVSFYLRAFGSISGNVYARLYELTNQTGTGVPTGSPISSSSAVNCSTFPTANTLVNFPLLTPTPLVSGRKYAITLDLTGTTFDSLNGNYVGMGRQFLEAAHSGYSVYYDIDFMYNNKWLVQSGSSDLCFYVYGNFPLVGDGGLIMFLT